MLDSTNAAREEFQRRTGLTVLRARQRSKGSMSPYIFMVVKCTDEAQYKAAQATHKVGDVEITFIDCDFKYKYDGRPISEMRLDIAKSEFKAFTNEGV